MRKSNYQESMARIKASDKLKADTIKKMKEELEKQDGKYGDNTDGLNKKNNTKYKGILGAAACFGLIITLVVANNKNINIPPVNEVIGDNKFNENTLLELPKLTVYNTASGGMGFEGYLAHDIDELSNSNPWVTSKNTSTMPVFSDEVEISVMSTGKIIIRFINGKELDSKYNFTHTDTTKEEAEKVLDYLIEEYSQLIDMDNPVKCLFGEYNIYDQQTFRYSVYENSGSLVDKILNYNFNIVDFYPNDKGKLSCINIWNMNITEKVGDYPIINEDEARTLLIEGKYTSTVHEEFPGEKYIKNVELIYKKSPTEENFIPYYRFYVELKDGELENGLKNFGVFYVPAVKEEYINYESSETSKTTTKELKKRESYNN